MASPSYGPKGYGTNKMPRWMRLLIEATQKNVIRTPNSHRLRSVSRPKKVRRVKARRASIN